MPLAPKLTEDEYKALEPARQGAYLKTDDGSYKLDVDVEDVRPLKSALENIKGERAKLKQELEAERGFLSELGVEKDELRAVLDEHRKAKDKKMIEAGEVEKLTEQKVTEQTKRMRDAHAKELKDRDERLETLQARLNTELVDNRVLARCGSFKVRPKAVGDVLQRARAIFRVGTDGDVHPLNPDGSVIRGKDGGELSFDEFFTELQTTADHLFESNNGSGAANPTASGALPAAGNALVVAKMSDKQKSQFIKDHGQEAWTQLLTQQQQPSPR